MKERRLLQNYFETIYRNKEECLVVCNAQGDITYHNPSFSLHFGNYDSIFDLFPDFPHFPHTLPMLEDEKIESDVTHIKLDGETFYVAFLRIVPEWEIPSPLLVHALKTVLNTVEDGISVIDDTGHFIFYNAALENLEGYRAQDVIGKHVSDLYNVNPQTSQLLHALESKQMIREYRQHYSMKNNRDFEVIIEAHPLFRNNKAVGAICIYKDKTMLEKLTRKYYFLQESKADSIHYVNTNLATKDTNPQLIGNNVNFLESLQMMQTAAASNSPVMIYGETGTGKELFAREIHSLSNRAEHPFIAINCAAIPESLLEGLLFGTVKGAFTGASQMEGLFEQANGGTIFLDELNSMPLALQAKILRAIEEKSIRRLGDKKCIPIDIRIVSSTNHDPIAAINEGLMRSDLFYRLAVFFIKIPPLRERIDDIELLVSYFIKVFNKESKKKIIGVHPDVIQGFKAYAWPGNIRQLRNIIECAMNFVGDKDTILHKIHAPLCQYL